MDKIYSPFSAAIIHELLDDEVIIANLDSGAYYSLRGTAASIWQTLVAGTTQTKLIKIICEKYNLLSEEVSSALQSFLNQLLEEELLLDQRAAPEQNHEMANILWPQNWSSPDLEKYDEMKNLLMLDPVHEADAQGWPHRSVK